MEDNTRKNAFANDKRARDIEKRMAKFRLLAWSVMSESERRKVFGGPGDVVTAGNAKYLIAENGSYRRITPKRK